MLNQSNNADFLDVLDYSTFADRKAAVREFVEWVKASYPDDVYFLSGKQLVDYMKQPFDRSGNPVPADTVASPARYDLFGQLPTWTVEKDTLGSDATVTVVDPNTMTIDFTVGAINTSTEEYPFVDVAAYFAAGGMANVSHIDIVYETEAPIRVRLLTEASGPLPMQVLLSAVGGERAARIRIKDFSPDPYADPAAIASADFVDATYMGKVIGLSFESASTKDRTSFQAKIKRIIVHGLGDLEVQAKPAIHPRSRRIERSAGSAAHWPRHAEVDDGGALGHHQGH